MALAPGTKLGIYEIQSPLGAGGMGEVYRATDTKLGRDIALKMLPAEMAQDPERLGRFRREAKALAQLDHPNIVTIHSVEESGGVHFLTMQLVEGLALDRLIPQGGLPVEQIFEIASALGDALAAAHEKGIVHRDLKPANVMVSNEGRVKVLDFGLAKDVRATSLGDATMTSASHTQVGVVMGTPAYMSPEQTSGRPLDHRTDIFSMGVVLHEMATGRRPFEGSSSAELVSAVLRDTPPSVTDLRPDLPSDLARVIRRCLEKDPRHRVQTARDVSNEFRDLSRQMSQKIAPAKTSTTRSVAASDSGGTRADEGFWVAVLPFEYTGGNTDLVALAEGLTEDIVTGLSRFSYLRVIARSSSARMANQAMDVRAAGKELGARYVMEGTLRQAGTKLRIAVQLVDTTFGAHLWAENYLHSFDAEALFELQDEIVARIVSTVADMRGILPRSMSEAVRSRLPEELSPYEALLRSFGYFERVTREELAVALPALEVAVQKAPAHSDAWAMLAMLRVHDYAHAFNLNADSLSIGAAAARRAVETGPSNHLAYFALAHALYFQKEFQTFRNAAEQAIALNPMHSNCVAILGELMVYAGDSERGLALCARAKQLSTNPPGWYWFPNFHDAYRQGDYRGALAFAQKVKIQGHFGAHLFIAAACGQLGEIAEAGKAVRDVLQARPDMPFILRMQVKKWWDPDYGALLLEGLRKAGMQIAPEEEATSPTPGNIPQSSAKTESGASRAEEGFWVAVLPFKYSGGNADLTALAEGLTEDVVTGLSRFSYLRVIARSSTSRFANQSVDIRSAGNALGARYLMEGSLRQAGTKLRLAVQLVDTVSGAHLWAENYERGFSPEDIFALQDDLAPRIVATVADQHGVLPHTMSNLIRSKSDEQLSPFEAVLRVFGLHERMSAEEHAKVRALLERTVQNAPAEGDCWAMLATIYCDEYMFGFSGEPDPLGRSQAAARRAIEIEPSNWLACQALAQSLFFRRELQAFRPMAERTMALNRMDGAACAFMGILLALAGEWERGCELADAAIQLNPHHPGWYWLATVFNAYRKHDYRASVDAALRINMPGYFWGPATSAAAFGQLGKREPAQKALTELLAIRPDFAAAARAEFGKWFDSELAEHYIDGLRKAGLEIADGQSSLVAKPADENAGNAGSVASSIAVLPFANMSADKDQEYFSDGLAEEIINLLAHIPGLKVIARTSAFAFRGKEQDIRGIADALGVTHVLQGSVRRAGDRIRVTVQLLDAGDGSHLWSERFDRDLSDVFAIQDEIGQAISEALKVRLTARAQTVNIEAYQSFLRGRYHVLRLTPESLEKGKEHLEQALAVDSNYAPAYGALAEYYHCLWILGIKPISEIAPLVKSAAEKALAIDPTDSEAHSLLAAMAGSFEYGWKKAETHHHKAMAVEPVPPLARFRYIAWYLVPLGRVAEAMEQSRLALEADPLNMVCHYGKALCMNHSKRYQETIECARKALEIDPNSYLMWLSLGRAQQFVGLVPEAIRSLQRVVEIVPWWPVGVGALAATYYQSGDHERSQEWAAKLTGLKHNAYSSAIFRAATGEVDAMFAALDEAHRQRDVFLLHIQAHPFFDPYRADPRFRALLRKMNLA